MEDNINKLIEVHRADYTGTHIFKITGNNCPIDYLKTVIEEYFNFSDINNATLHLVIWGLEKVEIEYRCYI